VVCKNWLHGVLCFVFQNGNCHFELYLFPFLLQKFGSTIHHCGSCIYIILKIIPLFSCTLIKVGVNDLVKYLTVLIPLEVTIYFIVEIFYFSYYLLTSTAHCCGVMLVTTCVLVVMHTHLLNVFE